MSDPETTPTATAPASGGGIVGYFRESLDELRRVNWPTRDEVIQGTQTVLIFVIGFTLLLYAMDIIFRGAMRGLLSLIGIGG